MSIVSWSVIHLLVLMLLRSVFRCSHILLCIVAIVVVCRVSCGVGVGVGVDVGVLLC